MVYQSAKSWTKIGQNFTVIEINFLAMSHDEQKYLQSFGRENRKKKTTWKK